MKKLGKLNLKKENMLSHEELVSFRGGSGDAGCYDHWYICRTQLHDLVLDCIQNCNMICPNVTIIEGC